MSIVLADWQKLKDQRGFTLVELMVAISVSAIIIIGSLIILHHMTTVSAEHRDETLAILNVQYVGFWISEDVVQAQSINLGNPDGTGFPLTIRWTEWDGDENKVTYRVEGMIDEMGYNLWLLKRTHYVKQKGEDDWNSYGTSVVSEYLDPTSTRCFWHKTTNDVLVVEVNARVDRSKANSTYQIHPRALL